MERTKGLTRLVVAFLSVGFLASVGRAETFAVDPMHSSVSFTVRHVIGNVTGRFDKFSGAFGYDPKALGSFTSEMTVEASSINTGVSKRDDDLRSSHFFDVQKFPTLTFKTTGVTDMTGNKAKLHGNLTIHGVTKPVVLDLEMAGIIKDPMGPGNRAGGTAKGIVNREDFGVGPASGPMAGAIGKDITIVVEVEGTSKP